MKRFLLFWIFILMVWAVFAQGQTSRNNANGQAQREPSTHVTATQAMDVAYAFMHTGSGSKRGGTQSSAVRKQSMQLVYTGRATDSLTRATTDCYYVFALQPKGFVIVAADERVNPILGYSYDNDFVVENMPDHVRGWLSGYEKQIETVVKQNVAPTSETTTKWSRLKAGQSKSTRSGGTVGPLLTTTWGQYPYYNALCPENEYGQAVTGCVATAIAQIINYWGYPTHGRGIHSYECGNYGNLTVNYDTTYYDYNHMPDALTDTSTPQEINAIATLMRDCGVGTDMGYGTSLSTSTDLAARVALINYFHYSPNLSVASRAHFTSSEWDALLHADLDNNRPVYYSGDGSIGHAFVCDGYNADGYYHFNFGWSGSANGWFLTSSLTSNDWDLNSNQFAIFGIFPDSISNVILDPPTGTCTFTINEPLEFCSFLGHNAYEVGANYQQTSIVRFVGTNNANQLVADIIDFHDEFTWFPGYDDYFFALYDGNDTWLSDLYGYSNNVFSPVLSDNNTLVIKQSSLADFKMNIIQTDGCVMVSNITPSIEGNIVHLTWRDNNGATQWQIEYGEKGFELGNGIFSSVTTDTITFNNLQSFTEYDFYIRSVCSDGHYGLWKKVTLATEAPYWQDIVSSQPAGYVYDATTNSVQISTAEQLTWWAKTGDGIDGHLAADIDLSGYNWRPTELFNRNFNGHGHVITNVHIKESTQNGGFFSVCWSGSIIENLGINNSYIQSDYNAGGLCCVLYGIIRNCYVSNCSIDGNWISGGLVGNCYGTVLNSFANASVVGNGQIGLMIGYSSQGTIRNCYAAGDLNYHRNDGYTAGVVAYATDNSEISNCYSVNTVGDNTSIDVVGFNLNNSSSITSSSTFAMSDSEWTLLIPVVFDNLTETDLLSALNRWVELNNDSLNCTWTADTNNINGGYPVFGKNHIVYCQNVSEVLVQQVSVNENYAVVVSWTENGAATQWLVGYRHHDRPDTSYIYVNAFQNPDTIFGIPLGYTYDFIVRAVCDTNMISGWSEPYTLTVDLPYWTDIVTTQPAGYVEDANGNVEIYSAEGLAWLAVITNGFHNQQQSSLEGKTVTVKSDINIEGYRWYPIGMFSGLFDGNNHRVSNIYMNDNIGGLFGLVYMGSVKNVHLDGGIIICGSGGGLINNAENCNEISNCHTSVTVHSNSDVGSLCGQITNYASNITSTIFNCSASGTVYGRKTCGNLIGSVAGSVEIRNCYATGNVNVVNGEIGWYARGGLIGSFLGSSAYNCFSTGSVDDPMSYDYHGKIIGGVRNAHSLHHLYSKDDVNMGWDLFGENDCEDTLNISLFHHDEGTNTLLPTVLINGTIYYDLLDALNAWVIQQNDSTLKSWTLDFNTGFPIFGDYFVPSCYNPTNLIVSQATVVDDVTIKTRLEWIQEGEPDQWEVLYVAAGKSVDSGTIVTVNSNPCVLAGIPTGQPLDFYVRAVCNENNISNWCGPITYIPDKLHWTEVVTSQPEGFQEDGNGTVYISSAAGLSWLSSIANGLNGAQNSGFNQIILTNDIDLSAYRWTAISNVGFTFNGNNHVVSGMYCNELSNYQGLFGNGMGGDIKNLILTNCYVYGEASVGAILGYGWSNIINCLVNGYVRGTYESGGLVGTHYSGDVENSCFIGTVDGGNTICGFTNSAITNCYTASTISNTAYKTYYNTENSNFTGSGTTWALFPPAYIDGSFHTNLVDALNAWVDVHNTDGRYKRWVADTNMINGGYPVFESVPLPAVTSHDTVVAQGYYSWHGKVFTTDTVVVETIPNPNGYDSIVIHHIVITPAPIFEITINTCSSYIWNGITYTKTGDYVQTFPSTVNADSVAILHLTVNSLTGMDERIICDNSYTWIDGVTYLTSNNTATYKLQTADGCDSVVTLHLTITHTDTFAVACDSFVWHDITYTESGDYNFYTSNVTNCDSVVTLHLTVNHTSYSETSVIAYQSYDWYEYTNLTQSGDYTRIFTNDAGCDSIVTLHLSVYSSLRWTDVVTSKPEGYQEDENGNLYISSAEGLAWLSSVVNELNGAHNKRFNHIVLTSDIDMSSYRWTPIGYNTMNYLHCVSFNGNNHVISGLYCNNRTEELQGLFGFWEEGDIHNLTLTQCEVQGLMYVGAIAGYSQDGNIYNCVVNGNVKGSVYAGGIVGHSFRSVMNSCFVGTVSGESFEVYGGITNCYSVNNNYRLYYNDNNSTFSGSGNTWTLSTPPYINGAYHSDLVDALNAWVDEHNTDGKYRRWVADSAMVNGGYPVFEAFSYPVFHDTLVVYGSYNWHGKLITSDTVLADTILTTDGFLNVLKHHLFVYLNTAVSVDTCDGYFWEGETYYTSGEYTYSHIDTNGYTLVDTLHLTVRYSTMGDTVAIACDSFDWYEHTGITQSCENLTHTFPNAAGCDSLVTLHLTVNHPQHESVYEVAYDSYQWNGETYNTTGVYTYEHLDDNGCMQVDTLHLTVYYSSAGDIYETACETFTWNGETFTSSGEYERLFHDIYGADSVVTLHLIINYGTYNTETLVECDNYEWNNDVYAESGLYLFEYMNADGCPSVDTLHLTINYSTTVIDEQIACESFTWIDGNTYTESTNGATFTLTNAAGCDSLVILYLTIGHPTTAIDEQIVCGPFTWIDGNTYTESTNEPTFTLTNASGCDSVVTLHLTIYHLPTVTTAAVSNIATNWVSCGGNVIHDGGAAVTARGLCWSTSQNPTISDAHTTDGAGMGSFTSNITGLSPNTTYYARAYASNHWGTSYGEEVTFTTADFTPPAFTCGDNLIVGNNSYTTHQYGSQCWMTQNLRSASGSERINWPDVLQSCPAGWHLPNNNEWNTLGRFMSSQSSSVEFGNGDFWTSSTMPWTDGAGNSFTLIAPTIVQSYSVVTGGLGYLCEVHDAANCNCIVNSCISVRCVRDEIISATLPTVITIAASDVAATSVISGGNITDDGGATVTTHGVCWSTSQDPTIADAHTTDGTGTGSFTSNITDLTPNTTYYVRAYATNCEGTSYGQEVSLHTLCDMTVSEFNVTTCDGYIWDSSIFTESGDYSHTFTNVNGCDSVVTLHLTISPTYIVTDTQDVCANELPITWNGIQFTEAGAQTVTLQTVNGCDSVVTMILTTLPTTTGIDEQTACGTFRWIDGHTYTESTNEPTFTLTNTMGCDSVVTLHLTINHSSIAFDEQTACDSFTWIDGNTYTESTNEPTITLMNAAGCDSVVTLHLTISHADSADFAVTACESYEWNGEIFTTTGDYTRTLTCANGCDSIVTLHLTIMPTPTAILSGNTNICESEPVVLNAIVDANGFSLENLHYTWYANGQVQDNMMYGLGDNNEYAEFWDSGTEPYHFMVEVSFGTDASCVFHSDEYLVYVHQQPSVHIFADETTICEGSTATLTAWVDGSLNPNYDYQWFRSIPGYTTEFVGIGATYTTMGNEPVNDYTYWVQVTSENGCSSQSNPITLTVNPSPSVFISGNTEICFGNTATLYANVINGQATAYVWYKDGGSVIAFNTPFITVTEGGTYTVEATVNGCQATENITINVSDAPETPVVTVDHTTIYDGGIVTLSVINPDPDPLTSYTWYRNGEVISGATQTIIVDNPMTVGGETTSYVYTVAASHLFSSCAPAVSASVVVTVSSLPVATVTVYGNTVLCEGSYVTLHVDVSPYDNHHTYSYQWYEDGMLIPGATSADYNVIESGRTNPYNFMVMVSTMTGGFNITAYAPAITGVPAPMVTAFISDTAICEGSTATLTALVDGGLNPNYDYQWYRSIPGSIAELVGIGATYTTMGNEPANNYTYWVLVSSEYGCSYQSDPITLTVNQPTTGIDVQTACGSFTWIDGITYTESNNTATYTLTNAAGCDSVVTLNLTINQPATGTDMQTACGSFTWIDGVTYTENNNTATYTLTNAAGCDSVVTLHLTVNHASTRDTSAVACGSFTWYGTTYTQTGDYTRSLTNAAGCDSTVTLHLTINTIPEVTITGNTTICPGSGTLLTATGADSYMWSNYSTDASIPVNMFGAYSVIGYTSAGCYNTASVTVLVAQTPVITVTGDMELCMGNTGVVTAHGGISYVWSNGSTDSSLTVSNAGTWQVIGFDENGCNGMTEVSINVWQPATSAFFVTACDSYTWNDSVYTQSGDYTQTLQMVHGCDSVVTLHLTVNHTTYGDSTAIVCGSLDWYGMHLDQSGDYTHTLTNVSGCDSVVTLHLTINAPVAGSVEVTACDSYTWNGVTYTESGDYTQTFSAANGCDSVVTLHLTINSPVAESVEATACDSYIWNEITYTESGDYIQTFTATNGCDSVVTLHLTINQPATGIDVQIACGSFTWIDGVTYTESNNSATYTLTNTAGCDSIVTLHLTVNQPVTTTSSAIICDSELPYVWNGVTFNEAGTQNLTLQTVNGCDSMVEMTLTVNPSVTIEAYLTISENDLPYTYGDTTFMPGTVQSGDYIFNFTTADGCDSVIILHLTVETGINDYALNVSMKVYPNPTKDLVNVQLTINNEQLDDVVIQLFDVYGKMLDVIKLQSGTSLQTQIDLSRYANGMYLVKAVAEGNVLAVRKVVKK